MRPATCLAPILLLAVTLSGCTTPAPPAGSQGKTSGFSQQDQAGDMFFYRREAADLRDMANRRRLEADVLAKELGSDHEDVKRKRALGEDLLSAADEAERKARDLRRHVPHGMVQ